MFPEEGWRGPCGLNEVTCHVSGYGSEGLLTFDWKHFPYEVPYRIIFYLHRLVTSSLYKTTVTIFLVHLNRIMMNIFGATEVLGRPMSLRIDLMS